MNVIEFRGISKEGCSFRDLHCQVRPGELLSLVALAGSDAPSLARILSLLEEFQGEFFLLGSPVHQLGALQRRAVRRMHLGVVLRSDRLIPELTVRENLELPLIRRIRRSDRDRIIEPVLGQLGLKELSDSFPRQLSDRQGQLAKIARAVVAWPAVLVGEEISAGLRRADWQRVMALLGRLRAQGTVLALTSSREVRELGESGSSVSMHRYDPPPEAYRELASVSYV